MSILLQRGLWGSCTATHSSIYSKDETAVDRALWSACFCDLKGIDSHGVQAGKFEAPDHNQPALLVRITVYQLAAERKERKG